MQVSLQALKAFESAARLGSFKLAAEELSLSPTAISHHISNLESRLNLVLFQRQVRKITLTEAGKQLSIATTNGFRTIENALEEIATPTRSLKVSTTSSLAALVLIPALQHFHHLYPDITVEISTGEGLNRQQSNLPVRLGNTAEVTSTNILKHEIFDVFCTKGAAPSLSTATPTTLFTTQWKNKQLAAPPLEQWLQQNQLSPSYFQIKTFDQELYGIQEALTGNGLVFCSTTLVDRLVRSNILQKLNTQPVKSALCYYVPDESNFTHKGSELFIDWLRTLLNPPSEAL